MATTRKKGSPSKYFYKITLPAENVGSQFYPEYFIISQTVDSVNNFHALHKTHKSGLRGPSTHAQQDLHRAMLVFACAGLDAFVKKLVKDKLPSLISLNKEVEKKFIEHILRKDLKDEKLTNTLALALANHSPRDILLGRYIESMTSDSLQSAAELTRVSNASGLDTNKIFSKSKITSLSDAFFVRNQIVHEMDINPENGVPRTSGYRTRIQRVATQMERHTKTILLLAEELLAAYKEQYNKFQIGVEKKSS